MNTIPTTFNQDLPPYTILGSGKRAGTSGVTAVLLNRGGRYLRRTVFQDLERSGFDYVLSVEEKRENYDIEELCLRYPFLQVLLVETGLSLGSWINLAAQEVRTSLFFVLWNDIHLYHGGRSLQGSEAMRIADRVQKNEVLCTVPLVQNSKFESLPTLISPAYYRGTIKTLPLVPRIEGAPSLYPFDGVGIYHRDRFIQLGGFDTSLTSQFWQLMDFGFRAHLWGEEIRSSQAVRVMYDGEIPPQDTSVHPDYKRFYLKNIAPVFRGDSAYLPWRRFIRYFIRSGDSIRVAHRSFREARRWVSLNGYRFRKDARLLTELWEAGS
ncbi:MAG: hypothetical protein SNJ56_03155 [Termitinemataceae bacterium]